jgi:hypothetical protein
MGNQAAWGNGMALSPDGSRPYVVDSKFGVNNSPSVAVLPETGGARWPSPALTLAGAAGILVGVAIHSRQKLRRQPSASR